MEALTMMVGLTAAMPDLKFDVQQVTENGNQATVKVQSAGAHSRRQGKWGAIHAAELESGCQRAKTTPYTLTVFKGRKCTGFGTRWVPGGASPTRESVYEGLSLHTLN